MQYAENLDGIRIAFSPDPLKPEESRFYCDETMESRTGDKDDSPIQDIFEACQIPSERNHFLLLGHTGSGKSTELNKMSYTLQEEHDYMVSVIQCDGDLDLINPVASDLLILMGDALLGIANDIGCELNAALQKKFVSYWSTEIVETGVKSSAIDFLAEAEVNVGTPSFFSNILKALARIKVDLKLNDTTRVEYRRKIKNRTSEWLEMLKEIADIIADKLQGRQPILVFEDLDKVTNLDVMYNIFSNEAAALTGLPFPIVYTFPIALSYDPRFTSLKAHYQPSILPMIKLALPNGEEYPAGLEVIKKIVEKRAALKLFDEHVLENLIIKTGGSLRDLFMCINDATKIARRKQETTISMTNANIALTNLKSSLTRLIDSRHSDFLADICRGNRQNIKDQEMLLQMLQAGVVLEYNSDRWHDVHPLVKDFLSDLGMLK